MEQLHQEQAGSDFFVFAELLADYIRLLGAMRVQWQLSIPKKKTQPSLNTDLLIGAYLLMCCNSSGMFFLLFFLQGCFDQRVRAWQRWQEAQSTLQKKREAEAKLLWANKPDKLQQAKEEIAEVTAPILRRKYHHVASPGEVLTVAQQQQTFSVQTTGCVV